MRLGVPPVAAPRRAGLQDLPTLRPVQALGRWAAKEATHGLAARPCPCAAANAGRIADTAGAALRAQFSGGISPAAAYPPSTAIAWPVR